MNGIPHTNRLDSVVFIIIITVFFDLVQKNLIFFRYFISNAYKVLTMLPIFVWVRYSPVRFRTASSSDDPFRRGTCLSQICTRSTSGRRPTKEISYNQCITDNSLKKYHIVRGNFFEANAIDTLKSKLVLLPLWMLFDQFKNRVLANRIQNPFV